MPLNKQSGNMYSFVSHTWNPIQGGPCAHDCLYCYMKQFPMSKAWEKPLRLVEAELRTNLGEGKYIFVGSSSDMWLLDAVPLRRVLDKIRGAESRAFQGGNRYLFQTKDPSRFKIFPLDAYPPRHRLATTIETNRHSGISWAPPMDNRARHIRQLRDMGHDVMVTVEPVMAFDPDDFLALLTQIRPELVTFGADSGGNDLPEPEPEKLRALIDNLEAAEIPTFLKANLKRLLPPKEVVL